MSQWHADCVFHNKHFQSWHIFVAFKPRSGIQGVCEFNRVTCVWLQKARPRPDIKRNTHYSTLIANTNNPVCPFNNRNAIKLGARFVNIANWGANFVNTANYMGAREQL